MDVILHVGAHRTATTALQTHMENHRRDLALRGVVPWGPGVARGGLFRGAVGAIDRILPGPHGRLNGRCALRAEAVRQSGATHLIISDPNIGGGLRTTLEATKLYPDAGLRVAVHAGGFARHRLTIGLCVRSYVGWWTSALASRLPTGGPVPSAELREHLVTQPRRWRHIVEEIARALPDATVKVWTYEGLGDHPHRVLEELCGIVTPRSSAKPLQVSPSAEALGEVMAECGQEPQAFAWPEGKFMPFTVHEAEALDAQYDADLAWLAAGAGGFADYIEAPGAQTTTTTPARTADGRGLTDDGDHRHLA